MTYFHGDRPVEVLPNIVTAEQAQRITEQTLARMKCECGCPWWVCAQSYHDCLECGREGEKD